MRRCDLRRRRAWWRWLTASRYLALVLTAIVTGTRAAVAAPAGYGVEAGPFRVYPELGVDFIYESNYFRTGEDGGADEATWTNVLTPGLWLSALKGADSYELSYLATIGTVFSSSDDNYVNHAVNANGSWELGLRHRVWAQYEFIHSYDRRGTGDPGEVSRDNFTDEDPDVWQSNRAQLGYSFGSPGAKGRLDLTGGMAWRRYLNNDQEPRDNDRLLLDATYFWRVRPKTSLLFDVNWQDVHYVDQVPGSTILDSQEWRLYTGATWDATAKTSGTIKLGYVAKDFESALYEDYSSFGWEAGVQWRPRTYSMVNLVTARNPMESAVEGADAVVVSSLAADWVHSWKSYLRSRLSAFASNDEYLGEDRTDHRYRLGAGVFYQPDRRIELGAEYRYETRTSEVALDEYNNNVLMLTLDARY